jgi:hypothetical protein
MPGFHDLFDSLNMYHLGLIEFTKRLFNSGGISFRGMFLIPVYYFQLLLAIPFGLLQHLIFGRRIGKTSISRDPVFILGHYRSGTTYLHKLMAANSGFGHLTNYDSLLVNSNLLFGKKIQKMLQHFIHFFRIKNPFFNSDSVDLDDPAEEDDFLMNRASAYAAYWGFVFPRKWSDWLNGNNNFSNPGYREGWKKEYLHTLKYATFKNKGRQLILKNPPSTERISILLELFPDAKFIYIYRNPYLIYYSTRNMWKKAILPYFSLQQISDPELDDIIFNHYKYLAGQYELQKAMIPAGNLIEVSYEELKSDPCGVIQRVYNQLKLEGFDAALSDLKIKVEREKHYQNFEYSYNRDTFNAIEEYWGRFIHQWGYHVPEVSNR